MARQTNALGPSGIHPLGALIGASWAIYLLTEQEEIVNRETNRTGKQINK